MADLSGRATDVEIDNYYDAIRNIKPYNHANDYFAAASVLQETGPVIRTDGYDVPKADSVLNMCDSFLRDEGYDTSESVCSSLALEDEVDAQLSKSLRASNLTNQRLEEQLTDMYQLNLQASNVYDVVNNSSSGELKSNLNAAFGSGRFSLSMLQLQCSETISAVHEKSVLKQKLKLLAVQAMSRFKKGLGFVLSQMNLKHALVVAWSKSKRAFASMMMWLSEKRVFDKITATLKWVFDAVSSLARRMWDGIISAAKFVLSQKPAVKLVMFLIAVLMISVFWEALIGSLLLVLSSVVMSLVSGMAHVIPSIITGVLGLFF